MSASRGRLEASGSKNPVCFVHLVYPVQSRQDDVLNKWSRAASAPGWQSVVEGPSSHFYMEAGITLAQ